MIQTSFGAFYRKTEAFITSGLFGNLGRGHDSATGFPVRSHHLPIDIVIFGWLTLKGELLHRNTTFLRRDNQTCQLGEFRIHRGDDSLRCLLVARCLDHLPARSPSLDNYLASGQNSEFAQFA